MKIISLLENTTARDELKTEHGLSLYIEACGKKILFDFGETDLFYQNAKKLGVDLTEVDFAVLSHGHSDHGGGLSTFLNINSHAPVYISPTAFLPHYNGQGKFIGLDPDLMENERLVYVKNEKIIDTGLRIFNCNDKKLHNPIMHHGLSEGKEKSPDNFDHEQYLLIEENGKRVLLSGCSHKGILNIMEWVRPHILVGGFHISKISDPQALSSLAHALSTYGAEYHTCHCTGTEQYKALNALCPRINYLSTGEEIII